jgi:hypothetical protein
MRTPAEDELLFHDFATRFLGYGSLNASVWFVGPEAGGGASIAEVHDRVILWDRRGRKETEDLQEYHQDLKLPPKSDWARKEQATWAAFIRVIFAIGAKEPGEGDVLRFQVEEFGKREGDFCALDVSQISCPRKKDWILGPTGIGWLKTKEAYKGKVCDPRCVLFRSLLNSYTPNLVIFYGVGEDIQGLWAKIAGGNKTWKSLELPEGYAVQWPRQEPQLVWAQDGRTLFVKMPHPGAIRTSGPGSRNRFFAGLGRGIRSKLVPDEPRMLEALKRLETWFADRHPKTPTPQ